MADKGIIRKAIRQAQLKGITLGKGAIMENQIHEIEA